MQSILHLKPEQA